MSFNSLHFLLFFLLVIVLYFSTPHRFRWILLLGASYYFYMCFKPEYIFLLIISTTISYYTGIQMGKTKHRAERNKYLIISVLSNVGLLFFFKYFNFFNDSVRSVFNHYNLFPTIPGFAVILPIGISFYTFQTLSYTIDVYRGEKEPESHLGVFALYVAFFPQLVAGPIERSTRLLPQFFRRCDFDYQRVTDGIKLMLWGFFKKLVIADRLAIYVNQVYNNPADYHGTPLILATYFFAVQIYCDFSGYSDIAVGAAKIMGYDLMENFKRPYLSPSIAEFWRRWHISLSSWFRDYLYIPLGGNRVSPRRWSYNIAVVFFITGLWHGANWTFVFWGGLHGCYILFSAWTYRVRNKISRYLLLSRFPTIRKLVKVFITFHLVVFAWIFFRANSLSDAFLILTNIIRIDSWQFSINGALNSIELVVAFVSIVLLGVVQLIQSRISVREFLNGKPVWFRWACYYAILLSIILFGRFEEHQFIYFQF